MMCYMCSEIEDESGDNLTDHHIINIKIDNKNRDISSVLIMCIGGHFIYKNKIRKIQGKPNLLCRGRL